jgi:glycosyltransferase involved in cell wall biosynthesis
MIAGKLRMIKIAETAEKADPDLVVNTSFFGLYEPLPTEVTKVYYVHRLLGSYPISYVSKDLYGIVRPYLLLNDCILLNRAKKSFILANSNFTLSSYRKFDIDGYVVYYPCKLNDITPARTRRNWVVSIGRISPERAHHYTLEIAKHLPDYRFIIMGRIEDLGYYAKLLKMRPSNVTILTNLARKDLISILAQAKVYVNSRYMETFGVAVIEGMAAGCVPVVRAHGAPNETVTKDCGFKWKNTEEAVHAIQTLFDHEQLWKEMSENSIKRSKLFNEERFEERVAKALSRFLH